MAEQLYLHEEALLLSLRDREGTIAMGTQHRFAIAGALLAELLLAERVVVDQEGDKSFVRLVDQTPFHEPVLDQCLIKLSASSRRAQMRHWVARFSNMSGLKNKVAAGLCRKDVLKETEDKVLWLFRRKRFPELNPVPERKIVKKLEQAIFTDSNTVAPRTCVLLALAHHANLLQVSLDKKSLKERKARIEQVIDGDLVGRATKEAIKALQAAVAVAAIVPALIAASS